MISDFVIDSAIERAKNWLLKSGIQNTHPNSAHIGATSSWFDVHTGQHSFLYSEVAGYSITNYCYLHKREGDSRFLERAELAADWLEREALNGEGYRCRLNPGEDSFVPWLCSFDNAMILNGLVNLYRSTNDEEYLARAARIARWLVGKMQTEDGSFNAKLDSASGEFLNGDDRWSTQPAVLHIKHAIGLTNIADITGEARYLDCARKVCDWGVTHLQPNGRFVTNPALGDTYTHPHCYAIEGLVAAGQRMDEKYLEVAKLAASWLQNALTNKGSISQHFDGTAFSTDEHVDSMSQTARLWMILSGYTDFDIDARFLDGLMNRILQFQCESEDSRVSGGFYYGTVDGQRRNHISNHGTMFALQALLMYRDFIAGKRDFDMFLYI